jgi:hypothetical protein
LEYRISFSKDMWASRTFNRKFYDSTTELCRPNCHIRTMHLDSLGEHYFRYYEEIVKTFYEGEASGKDPDFFCSGLIVLGHH